jgi:hypothetical protein
LQDFFHPLYLILIGIPNCCDFHESGPVSTSLGVRDHKLIVRKPHAFGGIEGVDFHLEVRPETGNGESLDDVGWIWMDTEYLFYVGINGNMDF